MTDRYLVLVVDENEYDKGDTCEYELYSLHEDGKDLPFGVWLEEWYVPDGEEWKSHHGYEHHHTVHHKCYLLDWNEIGRPWGIKDDAWWKEKVETMQAMYQMMKSVYPVANKIIDTVVDILDPDRESLNEEMQGKIYWPDYYTLGHYIHLAKDVHLLGGTEEETNNE